MILYIIVDGVGLYLVKRVTWGFKKLNFNFNASKIS
jgi:hypothetical protein